MKRFELKDRVKLVTSIIILSIGFTACSSSINSKGTFRNSPSSIIIRLSNDDNEAAAAQLYRKLDQLGYDVDLKKDAVVLRDKLNIILQPKVFTGDLSRIVAAIYFGVNEKYKNTSQLKDFVLNLNDRLNIGSFSLDDDQNLVFTTHLTFVDWIEEKEVIAFKKWVEVAVLGMLLLDDAQEILE